MKSVKKSLAESNNCLLSASHTAKKPKILAAFAGFFLLVEGCAAIQPAAVQKRPCNSPAECRIESAEKKADELEKRLEATKQKINDAEIKIKMLQKRLANMAMESLVIKAKKLSCEKFKNELKMMKLLARYDEHHCENGKELDLELEVKRKVHCPHIVYLMRLIKDTCDGAKD